jgi:hypothetical protein
MVTPISSQHINVVKIVTGQRIAKATVGYPPGRRAEDAASWIAGEIQIIPTVKLAAEVFGVSLPPVAEARKRHEWLRGFASTPALSDYTIECIVAEIGPERVMRSLDRLTQPELLVAAE